jgi:hypothetical protein
MHSSSTWFSAGKWLTLCGTCGDAAGSQAGATAPQQANRMQAFDEPSWTDIAPGLYTRFGTSSFDPSVQLTMWARMQLVLFGRTDADNSTRVVTTAWEPIGLIRFPAPSSSPPPLADASASSVATPPITASSSAAASATRSAPPEDHPTTAATSAAAAATHTWARDCGLFAAIIAAAASAAGW